MKEKIVLLATGGTIASTGATSKANLKASLQGEQIESRLPDNVKADFEIEIQNFSTVNSTLLSPKDMIQMALQINQILENEDVHAVVVTHGTSLMEETAFVLDTLVVNNGKPVVITGAQRNATHPWPDGDSNLYDAFLVAESPASRGMGVVVVFGGEIYEGFRLRKVHSASLKAFSTGEYGLLGCVYFDKVLYYRKRVSLHIPYTGIRDSSVAILPFYSGADEKYFEYAIQNREDGIVVEGVGLGNVSSRYYQGIRKAIENGIKVVATTKCCNGLTLPLYSYIGGGASLKELGVLFSNQSSVHARLLLILLLNSGIDTIETMSPYFNEAEQTA